MYLALMAVLVDESTQECFEQPLLAPGLDGAAHMLRKAHPRWSLLALYERDTLNRWLDLLESHPKVAGESPVIEVHVQPDDPLEQATTTVGRRPDAEVHARADLSNTGDYVVSRPMIERFVHALDRFEQCCWRHAA